MFIRRIRQLVLQKTRHVLYLLWSGFFNTEVKPDPEIIIDVVIPAIENDLSVLPLCIEGLRKNVRHTIKDIYLVSPNSRLIKDFANKHGVIFLDENTLLGYGPADIDYTITAGFHKGLNRSGWIFQQLVKLSGSVGACRYYLAIDADHILLKPHVFVTAEKKIVFYQSSEYNAPYYKNIRKLLRFYPSSLFSYVSHKMIFDKEQLKQLHLDIETKSESTLPWDKVIISNLDSDDVSGFSEFELFGNYVPKKKKVLLPWREKMLPKTMIADYEELKRLYPGYLSLTFPAYLNQNNK
jgi:hypothetical protein